MNKEEINEVLEELHQVEPEMLNEKALRLFNAIMSIADERDKLQQENIELKKQLLEKKCSDKDIEYKEKIKLQQRIDKAIEYIEYVGMEATFDKVLIEILKGE